MLSKQIIKTIASSAIKKKHLVFFLLICLGSMQSLFAQKEYDIYSIPIDSLWNMEISGVSRYKQSADKTPNSVIVITEQQIELRGYQDLSDVLKDIPGLDISDNASRFGEYLTLRGIQGNERILVLLDGHKLNPPTGTLLSIGNSISVRFAKQIEIIYGPASAMYGADAYSGVINIISKDSYKNKINTVFSGSYASLSSIDAMVESRVKVNNNLSFTVFGRMFRSEGFDVVGTDSIYNIINRYQPPHKPECEQPINDYSFFLRTDYKNFTFGYFRQMFDEGNAYTQDPAKNVYSKENIWKLATDNIWASYKKEVGKIGILSFDLNLVSFNLNNNTQFTKWVNANDPDTAFRQYMTGSDMAFKGSTSLQKVFSKKLQFIAGFDYEHIVSIPPYANDELFGKSYKYEGAIADTIDNLLTLKENRISGYGQIIYTPFTSLNVIIGGRFDYSSRYGPTLNPRLGFTYSPFEKTILKFNYGTAFQAPSLFFQYEQWGSATHVMLSASEVQKLVDPNWDLKNQLVSTYEISLAQQLGNAFQFKTSVYYNKLTDIIQRITFDNNNSTYNKYYDRLSNGVRNENVGIQTIKGLNAELNYGISDKLETYFYYCYTKGVSEEAAENIDIPRISENKIWLGGTYYNLFGKINISPRFRWIGEMNNSNKVKYPDGKQKGYTAIDLSLSVNRIFGFLKFYAQFNNLLDQKIEHAGLYQQTGGYLPSITQEGLRIKFGIEINFIK